MILLEKKIIFHYHVVQIFISALRYFFFLIIILAAKIGHSGSQRKNIKNKTDHGCLLFRLLHDVVVFVVEMGSVNI